MLLRMNWAGQIIRFRRELIVLGIALVHAGAAALFLSQTLMIEQTEKPDPVLIDLADLIEPPQTTPEPTEPDQDPLPPVEPLPAAPQTPPPANRAPQVPDPLSVLTQAEPSDAPDSVAPILQPPPSDADPSLADAEMAQAAAMVLRRAFCAQPRNAGHPTCQSEDPFGALAEGFDRKQAESLPQPTLPAEAFAGSFSDRYTQREGHYAQTQPKSANAASQLHLWPDGDLFKDTLAPGAYNARRIREGKAPILDRDLERDLRNQAGRD